MKITQSFKKGLLFGLPILGVTALSVGVAVPLVTQQNNKVALSSNNYSKTSQVVGWDQHRQYLNRNEVSILISIQQNNDYIKQFLSNLIQKNPQFINFFRTVSTPPSIGNIEAGTGWMLDYSVDPKNSDDVTYYLATNIHVLALAYNVEFKNAMGQTLKFTIPVNQNSASNLNLYISQPQGHLQSKYDNTELDSYVNNPQYWNDAWYKLGNYDVINLGALNDTNSQSFQASFEFSANGHSLSGQVDNNFNLTSESQLLNNLSQQPTKVAQDISILKTTIPSNKPIMPNYFTENLQYGNNNFKEVYPNDPENIKLKQEYESINQMFNTKTSLENVNENSSYITKLRYLNEQIQNKKITKDELKTLFPFAKIDNVESLIVGGFPGFNEPNGPSGTKFSVGNVLKNEIKQEKASRSFIYFNDHGQLKYVLYDANNNRFLDLQLLTPGSSGSMAINQNNQIVGILWGGAGTQYNIVTPLFNNPKSNLVYKFLKYQNEHDKNSQLLKLFTGLYNYKTDEKADTNQANTNKNNDNLSYQLSPLSIENYYGWYY